MDCDCKNSGECGIPYVKNRGGRLFKICSGSSGLAREKQESYVELFKVKSGQLDEKPVAMDTETARRKLLGDHVSDTLSLLGITEEKVSSIVSWLGMKCGCKGRKEKLNKLHLWSKKMWSNTEAAEEDLDDILGQK